MAEGVDTIGFETPVALDHESFMRQMVAGLGHLNEGILGSDVAGAYVMNVGLSMGAAIEAEYKRFWRIERPFTLDEYAHVIVDLHHKIQGGFSLVSKDPEKVVVQTSCCPFTPDVRQSPSLCFMTSSLFGGIAARNFGYAKVVLHRRIALGDPGCHVTIHLQRTPEAKAAVGKEYFPDLERASPDIAQQLRLMEGVGRLRRQLGEGALRWDEVIRGAVDPICIITPLGKITYANARWRDVLGVEGEELVGGEYDRLVHPNDQQRAREARRKALRGERVLGVTLMLRHRDGTWRDLLVSMGPMRDDAGRIIGVLDIAHDVTEQRETERLKNDFMTTASHELRTPVTSIKVLTEVLLRSVKTRGPLDTAQFTKRIEMIQREADRLAELSGELLDVSRLHAGKFVIKRERHDLNDIVEACVERQRELLGETPAYAIALLLEPAAIPVTVERPRLEQVIANLLDNAMKYSPNGGEIAIATHVEGRRAYLSITDQGIGIPSTELAKIFTPFYRGSNASSRHYSGLGLGLHLSRAILEAHGGDITVQSAEGMGATFTLSLPLDERLLAHGPTRTTLVVDDDDGFQETLQTLLEIEGYDVILASNGEEALDKLEEVTPNLILLDLMMPRMNGYEFLRELERRGLRGAFPILIVTADATAKQKVEQLGAESYVAKPFDVTKFLDKVHHLTERERAD